MAAKRELSDVACTQVTGPKARGLMQKRPPSSIRPGMGRRRREPGARRCRLLFEGLAPTGVRRASCVSEKRSCEGKAVQDGVAPR